MVTELLGKAECASKDEKARQHPRLTRASAKLAAAVDVLLDAAGDGEEVGLEELWALIEAVASRAQLRAAVAVITDIVPPPEGDDEGATRALLATRIAMVSRFLKTLTGVIDFGSSAEAARVLASMQQIPDLLRRRREVTAADIDGFTGAWVVEAPGIREPADRPGREEHLRVLRADAAAPLSQAARDLRRGVLAVARPASAAPRRRPAARARPDPRRSLPRCGGPAARRGSRAARAL